MSTWEGFWLIIQGSIPGPHRCPTQVAAGWEGERQARGLTWNPKQMVGMALKTAVQVEGLVGEKYPLVSPVPPVPPTQHPGGG